MRASPFGAALVLVAAGCASRPPAPPPAESPAPVAPPSAASDARPALPTGRFAWAPAVRRLEVRTTVEVTGDPPAGGEAIEQVRTVAYLTDTLSAGAGGVRATGVVDSVVVAASDRVRGAAATAPAARLAPLRYRAALDARGVRVDPAPDAGVDLRCTAPTGALALGALAAVREALPRVPDGVQPGARWADTVVTARCAGPALLVVQTVSRYEAVAGEGGGLAVVRRSASTLRGQGAAGVRPLSVTGSATAETRYLLDPAGGGLAGASGEGRTAITVTAAGVPRRFVQRTRTEVAAAR